MSLGEPRMRPRAKTFCSEAWPWASLDEPPSALRACLCQYVRLPPSLGKFLARLKTAL